ncbi:GGDEF domain-containing protein [Methylobacterium sp. 17Sr1-1]|uniref:GGDEF domain-containing protein n=1 Tax=Methylobacterium sp. 17Sr1-1 TaxID=2202826 RepID=UPI000D6FF978|nr:GGDEF domain-containing protein [Methylobacterium sp. 17Sr1-1]AWN54295.1 GGDEF domain-containing protein [Methylobacterium sp. 17Sr1-1]
MTLTADDPVAPRVPEPVPIEHLDWLLRFDPCVEARHEAEHGRDRAAGLPQIILVGMVIYNVYNFTSFSLTPDIAELSVMARLLVVTPMALAIAWLVVRVGPVLREGLILGGMIGGVVAPILLFWLTRAPLGNHTFVEPVLVIIYGNVLLAMRFRHALAFSAVASACAILAAHTKVGLDPILRDAFCVQFETACLFSLYANYRMEERRCREYLRTLAAQDASMAAETARRRYQGLSSTDALTGLPNRRALDETAEAWLAEERPAALMMIDVDHFKAFNDTLGHPEGDACLRRIATLFATFVPGPNILAARFGGEEFAFVVRDAGAPEVVRLAAALVRAVEALHIVHPGRPDGHGVVTVSVGIALKEAGVACTREALLAKADQALYRAKRLGRNRHALAEHNSVAAIPSVSVIVKSA